MLGMPPFASEEFKKNYELFLQSFQNRSPTEELYEFGIREMDDVIRRRLSYIPGIELSNGRR